MKIQFNRMFFIIYLVLMNSFLFLRIKQITAMQLTAVVVIIYNIIFFDKIVNARSSYKRYIFILLCFIIMEMIITKLMYSESITLNNMLYRCIEFFALPYTFIIVSSAKTSFQWVIKWIKKIGMLVLVALFLVGLIYTVFHIQLIEEVFERSGRARILYGFEFLTIVWLINLAEACKQINLRKKISSSCITFLVIEPIYLVIFIQVRILVLYQLMFIAIAILFVIKSERKKIIWIAMALLVGVIVMLLPVTSGYIYKILGMFNSSDSSMYARISQINYYPNLIAKKPFFGYGTISGENFSTLISGEYGVFCPEDMGIIGFAFFYGVLGAMIYIFFILVNLLKSIKYRYRCPEAFFVEIFLILSSATMLMFDIQRGPLMILFLIIIEGGLNFNENNSIRGNEK